MLSKIYYGLGIGVISLYLLTNLLSWRAANSGTPQSRPIGLMRLEKGKYVYVAPSYPSSGNNPYSSGSRSGSRSYPSSGGSSGGK